MAFKSVTYRVGFGSSTTPTGPIIGHDEQFWQCEICGWEIMAENGIPPQDCPNCEMQKMVDNDCGKA